MKFEKLELMGFKSFRAKTELVFPEGITAIVGPNGCGKSNISDAIRWVLGEQSAQSLRGESMKDIIFNGSVNRKPAGYAQVTLIFSDENGNGTQGLSNIQVSRRLFRSGDSEYSLNNVPCRLKDIVHFFADTGIGKNSYAIIEQGRVDFVLKAKPIERRALFESAAGIMGYKVRRDEALRKLEQTKQNLIRVSDIYEEVRKQRNAIQRQVKKLKKFKSLNEQLRSVKSRIYGVRLLTATTQIEHLNAQLTTQLELEALVKARLASAEAQVANHRNEYTEVANRLKQAKSQFAKLSSEVVKAKTEIVNAQERLTQIEAANRRELAEREELNRQESDLKAEVAKLTASVTEYETLLEEKDTTCNDLLELIDAKNAELSQVQNRTAQVKQLLVKTNEKLNFYTNRLQEYEAHSQQLRASLTRSTTDEQTMTSEHEHLQQELTRVTEEYIGFSNQLDECQLLIHQLKLDMKEQESLRDQLSAQKRQLADSLVREQTRLSSLQELVRNREGFGESVKKLLKLLPSILPAHSGTSTLGDVIEAHPGYETAIEAALGLHFQDLIVATQDEALKAVDCVKEKKLDRSTFVWSSSTSDSSAITSSESTDGLDPIVAHFNAPPALLPYLHQILKDIYCVADLHSLPKLPKRKPRALFVTRDGLVFDSLGSLTCGGSIQQGLSVLMWKNQIKQLHSSIEALQQQLSSVATNLDECLDQLGAARERLEDLEAQHHELKIKKVEVDRDRSHLAHEITRLENRRKSAELEKKFMEEELQSLFKKRKDDQVEKERFALESDRMQTALHGLLRQVEVLTTAKQELTFQLNEEKLLLTTYREKRDGLLREAQRINAAIEATHKRYTSVTENLARRQTESQKLVQTITTTHSAGTQLEAVISDLDAAIKTDEQLEETTLTGLEHSEALVKQTRKELEVLLAELQRVQVETNRWEVELDHVCEEAGLKADQIATYLHEFAQESGEDLNSLRALIEPLKADLDELGEVNFAAEEEFTATDERFNFLKNQQDDLQKSFDDVQEVIRRINLTTAKLFSETFTSVRNHFREIFVMLFEGGEADLVLCEDDAGEESGIEIMARPPGKKLQRLSLMSGGEKALTALALLFALVAHKPSPFIFLDEVDAPLDEANIARYVNFLNKLAGTTQVIVVTHHPITMETASVLYGVTMSEPGVSSLISVALVERKDPEMSTVV